MSLSVWKSTFRVNPRTAGSQEQADIVGLSNGNYLVVWADDNPRTTPYSGFDIVGQIFDPFGAAIGGTLVLNSSNRSFRDQSFPQVDATVDGGFVLTYGSTDGDDSDHDVQRFDAAGGLVDSRTLVVDSFDSDRFIDMDIVHRPDGTSVAFYVRSNTSGLNDLLYRFVSATGTVGAEQILRSDEFGRVFTPEATVLPDGRVIVAFLEDDGVGNSGPEYYVINTDNSVDDVGNIISANDQENIDVAGLTDGGWVVTWRKGDDIYGHIFNSDGSVRNGEILLAAGTDVKREAVVTATNEGGFVLAWLDYSDDEISVRAFTGDGTGDGRKLDIPFNGGAQELAISTTDDGRIVLSWTHEDQSVDRDIRSAILDPRDGRFDAAPGGVTVARLEGGRIDGSASSDTIYGQNGVDRLHGNGGKDKLHGGAQGDFIYGNGGNDRIKGQGGSDDIFGGPGNDTAFGGAGADKIVGKSGRDEIDGDGGSDRLLGGGGYDKVYGGGGGDLIFGGGNGGPTGGGPARDLLLGGKGNDRIFGGAGEDWVRGNDGRDRIEGGADRDLLVGGAGADVFIYRKASDSGFGAKNRDAIRDFQHNVDKIDLSGIDADTTRAGNQAFTFIGTASFDDAGDLRARVFDGIIFVVGDRDGDGRADFEIELNRLDQLSSSDFIL